MPEMGYDATILPMMQHLVSAAIIQDPALASSARCWGLPGICRLMPNALVVRHPEPLPGTPARYPRFVRSGGAGLRTARTGP